MRMVVLGGGFGGVTTVHRLERLLRGALIAVWAAPVVCTGLIMCVFLRTKLTCSRCSAGEFDAPLRARTLAPALPWRRPSSLRDIDVRLRRSRPHVE